MSRSFIIIAYLFLVTLVINAQLSLDIGDGLTVETTGGLLVELSGDLEENNSGYLKGVVSSGDRGANALSQFAGLTITSGAVDKITRTTGSAFSDTAPKTSLRSYEISNTTGITSNISSFYVSSGINNESNGILRPYLFCYISGGWSGCVDYGTTENSIGASNIELPIGLSNVVITEGVGVAAKLYLEGPRIPQVQCSLV